MRVMVGCSALGLCLQQERTVNDDLLAGIEPRQDLDFARVTLVPFQPHRFTVRLSSTFCPIDIGTSNDIRKLGMTISELSLG
jgi:hypothetical protein